MGEARSVIKAPTIDFADWLEMISAMPLNDAVAIARASLRSHGIKASVLASTDGKLHIIMRMPSSVDSAA